MPTYAGAQLRHSRSVERDELAAAMLATQRVAEAAVRKAILRRHFEANIDLERANDADRALLSCAFLDPERDERSHR